jgi:putative oxidoreductase
MNTLIQLHNTVFARLDRAEWLLPLLARLVFAGVLLAYFWASGLTKLGSGLGGIISPSVGAYAQIFPRAMEAASYDTSQLGLFHTLVVLAGTWAEFILPLLIVLGLLTRLAALGMIGFVLVQTATDLIGHGALAHPETLGAWFDRIPDSPIMDQRALWLLLLMVLVTKGAGALSLDGILRRAKV